MRILISTAGCLWLVALLFVTGCEFGTEKKRRVEVIMDTRVEVIVLGKGTENLYDAIDEAFKQITDELSEQDRDDLAKRAAKMAVLMKAPERVKTICEHIVNHYQEKVEPNGFKAQVVTFDRECCVIYKKVLDETAGEGWALGGTTVEITQCDKLGDIPTKNWRANSWGKGEELYHHFESKNLMRAHACYRGCVLRCGRVVRVETGKWKTPEHEGSEYESICAFTFFVLNDDMDAAVHATYLCNEYGLDTISTGAVIAFAMDCYEQGMLDKKEVDGLDLSWGNTDTVVELVHRIGKRTGVGRILGEGVRRASQKIGKGSDLFAIEVKGLEGPAHDGRSGKALAIMYGTGNRGMCHIHALEGMAFDSLKNDFGLIPYGVPDPQTLERFAEEDKGRIAKILQDFGILPDILGICKLYSYSGLVLPELAELISSLTGWDISEQELLDIGERVYNLQRVINVREGIGKADDQLPERVCKLPEFGLYSAVAECEIRNYEQMLEEYYEARGWNRETGIPTKEKLQQLGLSSFIVYPPSR